VIESLLVAKLTVMFGLATWLSIVVLNNTRNFSGGAASVGAMMSMRLFEEPPVIPSPLLTRRVSSSGWHRAVFGFVLAVEIVVAVLLWSAAIALSGAAPLEQAVAIANVALSGFLVLIFLMMFGGAWFVYYIKQEAAQITHFALLSIGLLATLVVNLT
jgi:predicted small integral membrane protein